MNYYHEVNLFAFNYWWLIVIGGIIAMIVIGQKRYYLNRKACQLIEAISEKACVVITFVIAAIFTVCFVVESWRGVLQWLDNTAATSGDSPMYSLLLLPFVIALIAIMYAALLHLVGWTSSQIKYIRLLNERRQILRRRKERQRAQEWQRW